MAVEDSFLADDDEFGDGGVHVQNVVAENGGTGVGYDSA